MVGYKCFIYIPYHPKKKDCASRYKCENSLVIKVLWLATSSPFGIRSKVTISQIHPTLPKALFYITPLKVLLIYMHVSTSSGE